MHDNDLIRIRRLLASDAPAYQALRLAALRECPSAFSSSYEEECDTPLATIAAQMAPDSGRNRFGAFDGADLVGVVGVGRPKLRHKAFIRGMYVASSHRSRGVGKQLLEHAMGFIIPMEGLRQVTLGLTAGNAAALALYQTMGFTVFGVEPRALLVDGEVHDQLHMARVVDAS